LAQLSLIQIDVGHAIWPRDRQPYQGARQSRTGWKCSQLGTPRLSFVDTLNQVPEHLRFDAQRPYQPGKTSGGNDPSFGLIHSRNGRRAITITKHPHIPENLARPKYTKDHDGPVTRCPGYFYTSCHERQDVSGSLPLCK
jgi:hypothetical protein